MSVSGDDIEGSGCDEAMLCFLCCKPGLLSSCYGGMAFHKRCMLAVQARIRQVQRTAGPDKQEQKQAVAREKKFMQVKPIEWRVKVAPFASDDRDERKAARASTRSEVFSTHETTKVEAQFEHNDDLILTRSGLRAHRKEDSDFEEEAVNDEFGTLHTEQRGRYDHSSGVARVRVPNLNAKIRRVTGTEERQGVKRELSVDGAQENIMRSQLRGSVGHRAPSRGGGGGAQGPGGRRRHQSARILGLDPLVAHTHRLELHDSIG